jgi:hypothetical protein
MKGVIVGLDFSRRDRWRMKRGFYLLLRPWVGDISSIALLEIDGSFRSCLPSPVKRDYRYVAQVAPGGNPAFRYDDLVRVSI